MYGSRLQAREYRESWWAVTDSNRRHPACKAGALPAELTARRTLITFPHIANRPAGASMRDAIRRPVHPHCARSDTSPPACCCAHLGSRHWDFLHLLRHMIAALDRRTVGNRHIPALDVGILIEVASLPLV